MTQTLIFQMNVTAPETLAEYRAVAAAALQKHGGAVTAASPAPAALDPNGGGAAPGMLAVLSFPDKAAAEAWMNDPALAEVHALRNAAGTGQFWVL